LRLKPISLVIIQQLDSVKYYISLLEHLPASRRGPNIGVLRG
jgi:hypothetical protein